MLAKVLFELAVRLKKETGADIRFINLSGGIGIPYRPDQEPNDIRVIGEGVRRVYEEVMVPAGMGDVAIYTEPVSYTHLYNAGSSITLSGNATMYAVWVERPKQLQSNSGRTEGINGTFKDSDHKAGTYRYQITYPAFISPPSLSGSANGSGYWEKHHGGSSVSFENVTTTSATLVYTIYSNSGNNYTYQTWAEWTATGYRYQ